MTTKTKLRTAYITHLKREYPFYTDGSRPLALAHEAIDNALSGRMTLRGECWDRACRDVGLPPRLSLDALKGLPE